MSAETLRKAAEAIRHDNPDAFMSAVADWLEGVAGQWEAVAHTPEALNALAVAHAYLGSQS